MDKLAKQNCGLTHENDEIVKIIDMQISWKVCCRCTLVLFWYINCINRLQFPNDLPWNTYLKLLWDIIWTRCYFEHIWTRWTYDIWTYLHVNIYIWTRCYLVTHHNDVINVVKANDDFDIRRSLKKTRLKKSLE